MHTPRRCGDESKATDLLFLVILVLPFRTNCEIVGIKILVILINGTHLPLTNRACKGRIYILKLKRAIPLFFNLFGLFFGHSKNAGFLRAALLKMYFYFLRMFTILHCRYSILHLCRVSVMVAIKTICEAPYTLLFYICFLFERNERTAAVPRN